MGEVVIRRVRTVLTAPEGITLVVVKVETSEPGLYGLGCGTFTQHAEAVKTVLDRELGPWAEGRPVARIADFWQTAAVSGYWRNGPVLNAALSGIDMALWDIKGKMAQMPCYELWGGKCRDAVALYRHADGTSMEAVGDQVEAWLEAGYRYVRCQWGGYGGALPGDGRPRFRSARVHTPDRAAPGRYFDPDDYRRRVPQLFRYLRERFGADVELLHDVHERLAPVDAVRLAEALAPYDLFFLEDALAPEDLGWFSLLRQRSSIPLAMGELFVHPLEWEKLFEARLIDYIRVHLSQIGGVTPALRLAAHAGAYGVRTAWHGPGDVSPIGHVANLHLDLVLPNFGIQEWAGWSERSEAVFPGCPVVKGGYAYVNDKPGWGIDLDEAEAEKFPPALGLPEWTLVRLPDGTAARP
ncbi:MAG: starvation-sensing protein RspA [Firmicutes bacterium]|nr:starvation-sensing protein RspA [Bacillota bacterium]